MEIPPKESKNGRIFAASAGGSRAAMALPAQISKRPVSRQSAVVPQSLPPERAANPFASSGNTPQAASTAEKAESSTTKAQMFTAEAAAEPTDRTSSTAAGSALGGAGASPPGRGRGCPRVSSRAVSRPAASWHKNKNSPTATEPKIRWPTTPAI